MTLHLGGITAWIAVDNEPLPAYSVERPQPNHATCWIGSEAGKRFSVNWGVDHRFISLRGVIFIDGVECGHHDILDAMRYPGRLNTAAVSFLRTSPCTQRDFMFNEMCIADNAETFASIWSEDLFLGTITLQLWCLEVHHVISQPLIDRPARFVESRAVHRESPMLGNHYVQYGKERTSGVPAVDIISGACIGAHPYATFTFQYRPKEVLKARGIIPQELKIVMYGSAGVNLQRGHTSEAEPDKNREKKHGAQVKKASSTRRGIKKGRNYGPS